MRPKNTGGLKSGIEGLRQRMKVPFYALIGLASVFVLIYSAISVRSMFGLDRVVFSGNSHITDEELRQMAGLRQGDDMLFLSAGKISGKLAESPWIRSVSVRKELPGRLFIRVSEAEPFALLDMKGRLFIVDERGRMLEELRETSVPFLPVITGNPYTEKEGFSEAINLVRAVKEAGLHSKRDRIEVIAHKPQDLAVNLDGTVVKVGAGDHAEKLARLLDLEQEIKERNIPVDYVDLRFANRVVVKAVHEVVR